MKLKELYELSIDLLKRSNIENPQLESMIIISQLLNIPKHKIFTNPDLEVKDYEKVLKAVEKRARKVPLAYILNKKEFFGLEFYIEEGVLIPRPETEILVEKVLEKVSNRKNPIGLEVGVGSGCICVSLLHHKKDLNMIGLDISEKALEVSKINAEKFNVIDRLTLLKFDVLKDDVEKLNVSSFDFVVSNPPYISENEYETLQEEVKKEPKEALISGKVGTEFYEKIVDRFKNYLKKDGFFAFEVGIGQGNKVKEILEKSGFNKLEIHKDLASIDRVVIGFKI